MLLLLPLRPLLQDGPPGWLLEAVLWVSVAGLAALVAAAIGVWSAVARLRELREDTRRLGILERMAGDLARLTHEREDLDLRRIEHVLVDLREANARLEDVLLRALESQSAHVEKDGVQPHAPVESLSERVVNRLLALGFVQVQLVSPLQEIDALSEGDGDVVVEAHKNGVLHKGRVLVRRGRLAEVEIQPSYSIFP